MALGPTAARAEKPAAVHETDALLVDDFTEALAVYGDGLKDAPTRPAVRLWTDALARRGVDPAFVARRLANAASKSGDPFARYRRIQIEAMPALEAQKGAAEPVALHAFRLDVDEEYDDVTNDDLYCYFIVTHDDVVWGRVTSIYRGLDEGTSVFLSAEDRALFGPTGEKLAPVNHLLVDFGIIESDGEDIGQLKSLSDAIIDLALVAVSIYDPDAGAAAAQARAEVQNLMHLIIEMDDDDRLVADTLRFTPQELASLLTAQTVYEFGRRYDAETFWTHYTYRLNFRLLK
jgi:hypothetical protein